MSEVQIYQNEFLQAKKGIKICELGNRDVLAKINEIIKLITSRMGQKYDNLDRDIKVVIQSDLADSFKRKYKNYTIEEIKMALTFEQKKDKEATYISSNLVFKWLDNWQHGEKLRLQNELRKIEMKNTHKTEDQTDISDDIRKESVMRAYDSWLLEGNTTGLSRTYLHFKYFEKELNIEEKFKVLTKAQKELRAELKNNYFDIAKGGEAKRKVRQLDKITVAIKANEKIELPPFLISKCYELSCIHLFVSCKEVGITPLHLIEK